MSQVFGENQPRTHYFRESLSKEKVIVQVSPEKKSNIVHTVTIKDAIMKCLDNSSLPGIYSLVNNPQWTWQNVIDYYKKPETIIVDMRNYYESEVGRFESAVIPDVEISKELLPEVKDILDGKEEEQILLYCTGGIRCEKASSYLMNHGFKNVNQLSGGIIQYVHEINKKGLKSKFIGKNFVFDDRLGERVTEDVIAKCHICGDACDNHTDCKNDACHILFIQCETCFKELDGCCSKECNDFFKLPIEEQKIRRKDPTQVVSRTFFDSRIKPKLNQKL